MGLIVLATLLLPCRCAAIIPATSAASASVRARTGGVGSRFTAGKSVTAGLVCGNRSAIAQEKRTGRARNQREKFTCGPPCNLSSKKRNSARYPSSRGQTTVH